MGDSLENNDSSLEPTQNVAIVDYKAFANFLRKAITILLSDDDESGNILESALDENRQNQECIKKFLLDPQVPTLYIQKNYIKGNF
jgi:hypothetical protein